MLIGYARVSTADQDGRGVSICSGRRSAHLGLPESNIFGRLAAPAASHARCVRGRIKTCGDLD